MTLIFFVLRPAGLRRHLFTEAKFFHLSCLLIKPFVLKYLELIIFSVVVSLSPFVGQRVLAFSLHELSRTSDDLGDDLEVPGPVK